MTVCQNKPGLGRNVKTANNAFFLCFLLRTMHFVLNISGSGSKASSLESKVNDQRGNKRQLSPNTVNGR